MIVAAFGAFGIVGAFIVPRLSAPLGAVVYGVGLLAVGTFIRSLARNPKA